MSARDRRGARPRNDAIATASMKIAAIKQSDAA